MVCPAKAALVTAGHHQAAPVRQQYVASHREVGAEHRGAY